MWLVAAILSLLPVAIVRLVLDPLIGYQHADIGYWVNLGHDMMLAVSGFLTIVILGVASEL